MVSCNARQERYEQARHWLDVNNDICINNLDSAAEVISAWPRLRKAQAHELRERFQTYQLACANNLALALEARLDSADQVATSMQHIEALEDTLLKEFQVYERYGISLFMFEGEPMAEVMPWYETQTFKRYLSECERELQKIFQREAEKPSVIDEEVVVDYSVISHRLFCCDMLMDKYPDDELTDVINERRLNYLSLFMYGTDNTPAFNWNDGQLRNEIRGSIQRYILKHPHAYSTPTLKEFIDLMRHSNFKRSGDVDLFISKTFTLH